MNLSRSSNLKILQAQVLRTRSWKPPLPPPKRKCVDWQPSGKKIIISCTCRSGRPQILWPWLTNLASLNGQPHRVRDQACKFGGPRYKNTSHHVCQRWIVELGFFFLFWIDFQVQTGNWESIPKSEAGTNLETKVHQTSCKLNLKFKLSGWKLTYEHMEQCSRRPSRCFHLRLLLRLHRIGFGSHFRSNLIRCHTNHIGCNTGCLGMSPPQPASHSPQLRSAAPAAGLPTPSSPPMHQLRPPSSFLSSSHPSLDSGLDVLLRPSPVQHASQVQFIAQPHANIEAILEHNFHPIKCINPDLSPKTIMIELLNRLGYDESSIR